MFRRTPDLELEEVIGALVHHGFSHRETNGSQQQWEGYVDDERRIVTVDSADAPFTSRSRSIQAILRQSGIPKRLFYWAAGKPLPWGVV